MDTNLEDFLTYCRSCGTPVYFAVSQSSGKTVCVLAEPVPNARYDGEGNVRLSVEKRAVSKPNILMADYKRGSDEAPALFGEKVFKYVDHHIDCPQSRDWRKN